MKDEENSCQYIIYACPIGELNRQIENYFHQSCELLGENKAHKYMPHCTLTGFFTDEINSVPLYIKVLDQVYIEAKNHNLDLDVKIKKLTFNQNWHGLELKAEGLKTLITNFAQQENLPTRQEQLRLKNWLHLSFAYDFNPEDSNQLQDLATEIIDLKADVSWELRFYQKNSNWSWKCLQSWAIV